ncbi:type II secretion system F family protein [Paeniglutamicibacter kerguelensis]|uniref:Tight adherence protein B n=1 Tax=Paeniglutamicibacter kerguelensis TaxID=254788 RepID=A0ABS4XF95_9MICC|nr:type II secretion system F family protein [Paeniglutamicibacter kerguelensis]MBP2387135.1 tight adherence protein B [Paeniglutamicibacter kerguelensis]
MVMILCATALTGLAVWLFRRPGNTGRGTRADSDACAGRSGFPLRRPARDEAQEAEEYGKLIRQLSALLRAGCSNAAALELLEKIWAGATGSAGSDIHAGCARALTQMRTGGTLRAGLAEHAATGKHHSRLWARLAWCFAISEQSGAALAELLDQLAAELENSADMRRALDAALAGPRATSRLLTFLPLVGLGLGQLLGIDPLAVLTMHPVGRLALIAGVLLWLANRWWCHLMLVKIVRQVPS